jgi:hypothetical protein
MPRLQPLTDYNKETAFLTEILFYDQSCESKHMDERIARVHREHACVRNAACTAAAFALLTLIFSRTDFFQSGSKLPLWALSVVGLASIICLLTFLCILIVYRVRLARLRDECRGLIKKLLEARLLKLDQIASSSSSTADTPIQTTSSNRGTATTQTISSDAPPAALNSNADRL